MSIKYRPVEDILSGPRRPLSVDRPRVGGGLELVDVEAGGVVSRHDVDG
jgi:hypothetical protein